MGQVRLWRRKGPARGIIDEPVSAFCDTHLGASVSEVPFRATSVGAVSGLHLSDGRREVLKTHQPARVTRATARGAHRAGVRFKAGSLVQSRCWDLHRSDMAWRQWRAWSTSANSATPMTQRAGA